MSESSSELNTQEYESESESEDEIEKKLKHKETDERKLSLKLPSPVEEASTFYPNKFSHFNLSDPFNRNIPKMPKTMATPASPDTLDSSIMPQDKNDSDEEEQIIKQIEKLNIEIVNQRKNTVTIQSGKSCFWLFPMMKCFIVLQK